MAAAARPGKPAETPGPCRRRPVASGSVPYDRDILDEPLRPRREVPRVEAHPGLVVEDRSSGFVGAVVRASAEALTLRDRHGKDRLFRWREGGFLLDGKPVTLVRPAPAATPPQPVVTASGSVHVDIGPKVLEHVWGDDLRHEGVVVEPLGGVDHLPAAVQRFRPGPGRRLGVLVDHLVAGSKEQRIARSVAGPHVLVTGTPFVDVWQGVRPGAAGIEAWPVVPLGVPWKDGVCAALGVGEPAAFWKALRNRVRSYADLEPELVGAVEQLIDFVTEAS
jgi:hypothetical protein